MHITTYYTITTCNPNSLLKISKVSIPLASIIIYISWPLHNMFIIQLTEMEMSRRRLDRDQFVIAFWLFCEVTVLSLVGVVLWLSLTPRNPRLTISDAHFPSLNLTSHTPRPNASLPVVVHLQIFNPNNHMGIDYRGIKFKLYTGDGVGVVGANSTSAFYQGYKNTTLFQMPVQASQEFWHAMNATSSIDFIVRVETAFRFRIIKWQTKIHHVAHEARFSQ